jgi:TolB-like protein/DNA-binding SARP family transcriptional activator/Tfp pilus assembly protein PilF
MNSAAITSKSFQLKLFGAPSIEAADGSPLTGRVVQRHRLALLALLAMSPGGRMARDKLIALLWPESDAEKARNLLNVATYTVRTALGEGAIVTAGDDLRLDHEIVSTDVDRFTDARARGDHAAAVATYAGPLLDGFFLSDAPQFEQWLDRERDRLAAAHKTSVEALAESAQRAGDHATAVDLWKRRATQDPYDSRVAAQLIQAMEAAGNRVGALQHASLHERMLREEFGISAPVEVVVLVERLKSQGTPSVRAPITSAPSPITPPQASITPPPAPITPPPSPITSRPAPSTPHRAPRWWAAAALLAAVLLVAGAAWRFSRGTAPDRSIAVLPFVELSAAADSSWFADGLTEEVIAGLSEVPGLTVISRTSAMHYKDTKLPLRRIAEELGVGHVLEGSVRRSGSRIRITAQLIDARSDKHLWAQNFDEELRDILSVQEQIARRVVQALEVELGDRGNRTLIRARTSDPEAYELYRRARFLWNTRTREGHQRAAELYRQAIARDSSFADAWAGLADTYLTSIQVNVNTLPADEAYQRARVALERALALDDNSADAHATYGIAMHWQHNWPASERGLRRALQLNPNHSPAHSWYGLLLSGMGRMDEAGREHRRASELDPFNHTAVSNYGWHCYLTRDYACAVEQLTRTVNLGGTYAFGRGYERLALTYVQLGRLDDALAAVRKAVDASPERPDYIAGLAFVHARRGERAPALAALRRASAQPFEPFSIGRAWIALGNADSAFAWLERSNWQWSHRANRYDPALDPIRSDPRFAAMSARIERQLGLR